MTYTEQLQAARAAILSEAPRIVEAQAQTALALVTLRVQNEGLGVPYSQTLVPVFFFANRTLNAGGRDYIKRQQKQKGPQRGLGTYVGLRGAQGLPTASVNLTYSGRTFRSLTTLYVGVSGTIYRAALVAADAESARVVGYNQQRYGDFLAPNASELAQVQQVGQEALAAILNQYFPQ